MADSSNMFGGQEIQIKDNDTDDISKLMMCTEFTDSPMTVVREGADDDTRSHSFQFSSDRLRRADKLKLRQSQNVSSPKEHSTPFFGK